MRKLDLKKVRLNAILIVFTFISISMNAQHEKVITWKQILKQGSDWYASSEAIRIADNVLVYQHKTGGWPKNIDMAKKLSPKAQKEIDKEKNENGTKLSIPTIDNGATFTQLWFLARVYEKTKIKRFKKSFLKGVDYLLNAQYENGGWPQFYPIRKGYYEHITYNDGAMVHTMNLLKQINSANKEIEALQLSKETKQKAKTAFKKGVQCMLKTQIYVNGKPTVWCAQHDKNTYAPAKARSYELPSFSGSESVGIVMLLMDIDNPSEEIKNAVKGAVKWFEEHKIEGIRVKHAINEEGKDNRIVVKDSNAPALWGRFYDLETEKAFFCDRDGIKKNTLAEIGYERRNGYRWYTNGPEKVLIRYSKWIEELTNK